jgi:cytochrome c oxidase accessory protein FixG
LWTGLTFVGYFTPIETLARGLATWGFGPWETFWILFYGFATYGNAGWLREQVCTYMCPYARFQSVMFDSDTLVITYDPARGEPRGPRSKRVDRAQAGMGDCVDCSICVQVCPTGIDIRRGLQYMCIGCAACIDGCNQVMDKMGYPRGLIRYSTEGAMEGKYPHKAVLRRLFRPRVLLYSLVLSAITVALAVSLYLRVPLQVDVMRDRWAPARQTEQGRIGNVYRLQITNMDDRPHRYAVSATGPTAFRVIADGLPLAVPALSSRSLSLRLQADPQGLKGLSTPVTFRLRAADDPALARSVTSSFLSR